jgi:uncharacterized RDD family membrane protein YckC
LERLDTTTTVDTPERVRFTHRLAGPGLRGLAWLLDLLVQAFVVVGVLTALTLTSVVSGLGAEVGTGASLLAFFVVSWFYAAAFEALWAGQTPAKRALQLRVVRLDGSAIGPREAVLRNLMRGVDGLPFAYVVGATVAAMDPRLRRLGDWVAGTMVVVEQRTALLDAVEIAPPVTEGERQSLPIRVTLSGDERRAIEALLRRTRRLSASRAEEIAAVLGPRLAEREGVVAPTWLRTLTLAYARSTGRDA